MVSKHPLSLPGIYRITRIADGKVYIGQTRRKAHTRWTEHKRELNKGMHRNWPLQEAWLRGEPSDFAWDLVCEPLLGFSPEDLTYLEVELLKNYPNHFNLNEPIQVYLGAHASTRAKYSVRRLEMWADPEFKEKRVAAIRELHADPTYRAKQQAGMRAFHATEKSKVIRQEGGKKASQAWKDRPEMRAAESARRKALWEDPIYRARMIEVRKAAWADPEKKAKRVASLKKAWEDASPEKRQQRIENANAWQSSEEGRKVRAEELTKRWAQGRGPRARKENPKDDLETWWNERLGEE